MGEWGNLAVGLWKSPLPFQTVKGHAIKSGSLQGNWVVQVSVNPSLGALVEWWSTVVPPSRLLCTFIPEHSVVGMAASAGEHIDNDRGRMHRHWSPVSCLHGKPCIRSSFTESILAGKLRAATACDLAKFGRSSCTQPAPCLRHRKLSFVS